MSESESGRSGLGEAGISVVVPFFNEEDGVDAFFARTETVLDELGMGYEIVCVDDGSVDGTLAKLRAHRRRNPAIKVIALSRNFGKEIALTAGLDHASKDAVIPMDSDLQDPPELIPDLVVKWFEGYDVVYASRMSRDGDSAAKRVTASWFYRVYNSFADTLIPADTGDFRLMDKRVVAAIKRIPERNRFMKGLFSWVGFRQIGVPYRREERGHGRSKWRAWRLWNFALDGIASSTTLPLRIWSYVGLAISLFAFAYAVFLVAHTLIRGTDVPGYASIMVAVLFLGGINLLTLGIIGEYLGRVLVEARGRPLYVIRDLFGFDDNGETNKWTDKPTTDLQLSKIDIGGS